MCGIAGIIDYKKQGRISKNGLSQMLNALSHRGPDGLAKVFDSHMAMGMTRLAIIDLKGGMQPLYNEDRSVEVICNGEIYNYKELRKKLISKNHKIRTNSDVETIVHLYEEYGLGFVRKLRGMFAIALYDKRNQKVILIRDRMGEKPIYYSDCNDGLIFSSEMKSILRYNRLAKDINYKAINDYFHFSYIPEPQTAFVNISKLPAGSLMVIDLLKETCEVKKYWNANAINVKNNQDPTESIKKIFKNACTLCLTADVDVGIALSGGLDSGAILAFSAPQYKDQMQAFTIGYEGTPKTDERILAGTLTKKFNVRHIKKAIKTKEFVNFFPELIYKSDDPIADIAGFSIFSVSKLAKENGIKVLLNGIGGDELFWGYNWISKFARKVAQSHKKINQNFYFDSHFFRLAETFTTKLYSKKFKSMTKSNLRGLSFGLRNKVSMARNIQNLIRDPWLISNCIDLNERLTMANSVELRSPLLDFKLVELAYSSKKNLLSYDKQGKYWFKKALEGIIPDTYMKLPKRGFTPPVIRWYFALIMRYGHLLKNGFLVQSGILSKIKLNLSYVLMFLNPFLWDVFYELLVLEVWGRLYVWDQKPADITHVKK